MFALPSSVKVLGLGWELCLSVLSKARGLFSGAGNWSWWRKRLKRSQATRNRSVPSSFNKEIQQLTETPWASSEWGERRFGERWEEEALGFCKEVKGSELQSEHHSLWRGVHCGTREEEKRMGKEKTQFLSLGTMEKIRPEGIVTMGQPTFRSTVADSPVEGGGWGGTVVTCCSFLRALSLKALCPPQFPVTPPTASTPVCSRKRLEVGLALWSFQVGCWVPPPSGCPAPLPAWRGNPTDLYLWISS